MHILTSHDVIAVLLPPLGLGNAHGTALNKIGNVASGNALDVVV